MQGSQDRIGRLFLNKEMGGTRQTERAKRQSSRKGRNTNRRAGRAVTKMSFAAQDILKNGITAMIQRLPKALDLSVADDAQYVNQNGHSAVLQASCHAAGHLFLVRRVVFPEFLLHNHARALVSAPVMAPYTPQHATRGSRKQASPHGPLQRGPPSFTIVVRTHVSAASN